MLYRMQPSLLYNKHFLKTSPWDRVQELLSDAGP